MLWSAKLDPSVFLVFYCNFVKRGLFCYKIVYTIVSQKREQMVQIWLLYDFYFFVYAYIVAKQYVGSLSFFIICLSNVVRLLQNFVHIVPKTTWTNFANLETVLFLFSRVCIYHG